MHIATGLIYAALARTLLSSTIQSLMQHHAVSLQQDGFLANKICYTDRALILNYVDMTSEVIVHGWDFLHFI